METFYFLTEQRTLGEERADSALLPSPLQEESYPALPADPARQGRGKRPHTKGCCPQWAAELPALELQVQRELQPRGHQATTGSFLFPPPSFPLHPFELFASSVTPAIQVAYQPQRPEESLPARPPYLPFPPNSLEAVYNRGEGMGGRGSGASHAS